MKLIRGVIYIIKIKKMVLNEKVTWRFGRLSFFYALISWLGLVG